MVKSIKKGSWVKGEEESSTGVDFRYTIASGIELKNLTRLIPEGRLFNTTRGVSCLLGGLLGAGDSDGVRVKAGLDLAVSGFEIVLGGEFEGEVKGVVAGMKERFCREDRSGQVVMKRRMVRVGFHNGWTMVSEVVKELEGEVGIGAGKKDGKKNERKEVRLRIAGEAERGRKDRDRDRDRERNRDKSR